MEDTCKTAAIATKYAAMAAILADTVSKNMATGTNQGQDRVNGRPARIVHINRRYVGPEWVNDKSGPPFPPPTTT